MSAAVGLFADPKRSEILAPLDLGQLVIRGDVVGESIPVYGKNIGTTRILKLGIRTEGPGAEFVQLATDVKGKPGVWAEAGRGLIQEDSDLKPGQGFKFWARGVFTEDDLEGIRPFEVVIEGMSL